MLFLECTEAWLGPGLILLSQRATLFECFVDMQLETRILSFAPLTCVYVFPAVGK